MADEQEEFGVKFAAATEAIAESTKSFDELGEAMKETAKAGDAVAESTKTVDDKVQQLRDVIGFLKQRMVELADEYKQGIHTDEQYKDSSDLLIRTLKEREDLLKRLTASERDHEAQGRAVAQATQEEAAALAKITAALNQLEAEEERELTEAERAAEKHYQLMTAADQAAGSGSGEAGKGGFAGLAANVIKAEKVMSGLASGSGFGRMGGMLESITGALGLAGGAGMAAGGLIFAFEALIPKVEKFIEKMDGAATAAKHAAEMMKAAYDQMQKLKEQPDEEEQTSAKVVKEALSGKKGMQIATGIEQSLEAEGYGLNEYQIKSLASPGVSQYEKDIILEGQRESIITRRGRIMKELEAGHQATISDVEGMAGRHEGFFPAGTEQHLRQALPENIEAAKKQARDAEEGSRQADAQYARQEAASKENLAVHDEFDKALKDKRKHAATEYDAAMKFAADWKAELDNKAIAAEKHAATKADHDAKAAKTKADHDARQNTPEASERRVLTAQRNEEMGMAQDVQAARAGAGDRMAAQMGPQELQQVVAQVGKNRLMNSSLGFTLAQQVDFYMSQLEQKMVADFTRGMGQHDRSGQNTNPRGGH